MCRAVSHLARTRLSRLDSARLIKRVGNESSRAYLNEFEPGELASRPTRITALLKNNVHSVFSAESEIKKIETRPLIILFNLKNIYLIYLNLIKFYVISHRSNLA